MHTCISSHGLKRSWRSCPRRVNVGNKYTPSMHHPRRLNVTTLMVGLKKTVTYAKISSQNGEPQRYSWGTQKERKKEIPIVFKKACIAPSCLHQESCNNAWLLLFTYIFSSEFSLSVHIDYWLWFMQISDFLINMSMNRQWKQKDMDTTH